MHPTLHIFERLDDPRAAFRPSFLDRRPPQRSSRRWSRAFRLSRLGHGIEFDPDHSFEVDDVLNEFRNETLNSITLGDSQDIFATIACGARGDQPQSGGAGRAGIICDARARTPFESRRCRSTTATPTSIDWRRSSRHVPSSRPSLTDFGFVAALIDERVGVARVARLHAAVGLLAAEARVVKGVRVPSVVHGAHEAVLRISFHHGRRWRKGDKRDEISSDDPRSISSLGLWETA